MGFGGWGEGGLLRGYSGTAGEGVEGYAFAEEDLAGRSADGGDVGDGGYGGAFGDVPFDPVGCSELSGVDEMRKGKGGVW